MTIETEVNATLHTSSFEKWIDFQEGENPIVWIGKGFLSYKKGWLFTGQRMIEYKKKKTLRIVPMSQFTEVSFRTIHFIMAQEFGHENMIEGVISLSVANEEPVTIRVFERYGDVLDALKAIGTVTELGPEVNGMKVFEKDSSDLSTHTGRASSQAVNEPSQLVQCPSCGNTFKRPRLVVTTEEIKQKYGGNPIQCPNCKYIWSGDTD